MNEDTEFRNVIDILKQLQQVKAPANFEAELMRRINSEQLSVKKTFWQTILIPSRMVPAAALVVTALLLILVLNNSVVSGEDPFSTMPRERHDLTSVTIANNLPPVVKNKVESIPPREVSGKNLTRENISRTAISPKSIPLESKSLNESGGLKKDQAIQDDRLEITKSEEKPAATVSGERFEAPKPGRQISKPSDSGKIAVNKVPGDKYINITYTEGKITDYPVDKAALNFRQIRISNEQRKELNDLKQRLESLFRK